MVFEIEICRQSQAVAVYNWLCAYDLLFAAFFLCHTHAFKQDEAETPEI